MDGASVIAGAALVAVGFGLSTTVGSRRSRVAAPGVVASAAAPAPGASAAAKLSLSAVPPSHLPTFAVVAGLDDLKTEIEHTVGLLMAHTKEAAAYRIEWNGLLFHGPPGVGKSFLARAVAGELR